MYLFWAWQARAFTFLILTTCALPLSCAEPPIDKVVVPVVSPLEQTTTSFVYDRTMENERLNERDLAAWERQSIPGFSTNGITFALDFWGRPDPAAGCYFVCNDARGGSTVKSPYWADSLALTGLADGTEKWSPRCVSSFNRAEWQGHSFARVYNDTVNGGIGLYTHSGSKPTAFGSSPAFFMPYGSQGGPGGPNRGILGTFATFRMDWWGPNVLKPWSTNTTDINLRRIAVRSTERVVTASLGGVPKVSVQQGIYIYFYNRACKLSQDPSLALSQPCHFLLEAVTTNIRTDATYLATGTVYADADQGGLPVIYGPISSAGQSLRMSCAGTGCVGKDIFTSWGPATAHGLTAEQTFHIEVSWRQLQNMLAITTSESLPTHPAEPTAAQIASLYGTQYNDPNEWVLLSIGVGQEVFDENITDAGVVTVTHRSFIGGYTRTLRADAIWY